VFQNGGLGVIIEEKAPPLPPLHGGEGARGVGFKKGFYRALESLPYIKT
jgi:hypothetical protein